MANGNGFPFTPAISYLRRFAVNRPGEPEVIRQRLYDHQLYPGNGTTEINFFQFPIGQGVATALGAAVGSNKTRADTNMTLAGQLSALLNFVIESIEVTFEPGTVSTANTFTPAVVGDFTTVAADAIYGPSNDADVFYKSGWLELAIGAKDYLIEAPLGSFPPKVQTVIDSSQATNSATLGAAVLQKVNKAGRPYFVEPAISLMSNQNFVVRLKWPAVVPLTTTFNARVGVILDGFTFRASQ
jgi:hypothetical protein